MIRIMSPMSSWGGSEMSMLTIAKDLRDAGHEVMLHPFGDMGLTMRQMAGFLGFRWGTSSEAHASDVFVFIASNAVLDLGPVPWKAWWKASKRRCMILNWRIGDAGLGFFREPWDAVGFLSSQLADEYGGGFVHAPAVDLAPFFTVSPDYSRVAFLRHSTTYKWPGDWMRIWKGMQEACPGATFEGMGVGPGPSWTRRYMSWGEMSVPDFLSRGSCYVYPLERGATEQGPRVVVEAMASGLLVITDATGGMLDRVTEETGWLLEDHRGYAEVARRIAGDPDVLVRKGNAARKRAAEVFNRSAWLHWILGG